MILVLRGHIRTAFDTQDLYHFIAYLYDLFPNLKIYIHTWNIFSNGVSWRPIYVNNTDVTEEIIYNYFNQYKSCIKHIIIDDDKNIELCGNLVGNINNGPMPIMGWKNYWYGKHKIIEYIYNQNEYVNEMIINTRFDLLNNSNTFDRNQIIEFIKNHSESEFTKNVFLFDCEKEGNDNIYIGNINTMYKLSNEFHYNLDAILSVNNDTVFQERLVYRINKTMFDEDPAV